MNAQEALKYLLDAPPGERVVHYYYRGESKECRFSEECTWHFEQRSFCELKWTQWKNMKMLPHLTEFSPGPYQPLETYTMIGKAQECEMRSCPPKWWKTPKKDLPESVVRTVCEFTPNNHVTVGKMLSALEALYNELTKDK